MYKINFTISDILNFISDVFNFISDVYIRVDGVTIITWRYGRQLACHAICVAWIHFLLQICIDHKLKSVPLQRKLLVLVDGLTKLNI